MGALFFALGSEAKPWIQITNAKPVRENSRFRRFESPDATIFITGIGKMSMAVAVAEYALSLQKEERIRTKIWNLGIAGSTTNKHNLGDFFWIHKLTDHSLKKDFYPERWQSSSFVKESNLVTVDHPMSKNADQAGFIRATEEILENYQLIDMEASGFFFAAEMYFPVENIQIGKIVSDHLEGTFCTAQSVESLINNHTQKLFEEWKETVPDWDKDPLTKETWTSIQQTTTALQFTESMVHELKRAVRYFLLTNPNQKIPMPEILVKDKSLEKREAKQIFERWKTHLYA